MRTVFICALGVGLLLSVPAWAEYEDPVAWDFEFNAAGGAVPLYDPDGDDEGIGFYPLLMDPDGPDQLGYLELEIVGLWHERAEDLDIYLINPYGDAVEIMTDLGGRTAIPGAVTLVFNDKADGIPTSPIGSSPPDFEPEGLFRGTDEGMSKFNNWENPAGTDHWVLVVIDDELGATGGFDEYYLRGIVPEPMTLTLLAVGALAVMRRRRS